MVPDIQPSSVRHSTLSPSLKRNKIFLLGCFEEDAGNMNIALKHLIIAAGCGDNESLKAIREFYMSGNATKDDYAKALRAIKSMLMKSRVPQGMKLLYSTMMCIVTFEGFH